MPPDQQPGARHPTRDVFRWKNAGLSSVEERHPHCSAGWYPMIHTLSKSILACLLGALALCAAGGAFAQTGTGGSTGAAALSTSDFTFFLEHYDPGQKQWTQMNSTQQQFFFNRVRCECDGDTTNWSGYFKIAIQPGSNTSSKVAALLAQNLLSLGSARLYAGGNVVNCLDPTNVLAPSFCLNLIEPGNQAAGIEGGIMAVASLRVWESNPIPAAWLFNSATPPVCQGSVCDSTANCGTAALTSVIYFWAQTTSLTTPDLSNLSFNVTLVGQVAFAPTGVTAVGGNEALAVSWGWPTGINPAADPTFLGMQLFCVRGQDTQVFPTGTFGPAYMTPSGTFSICPNVAPASSSTGILGLDPNYLCSGLVPSTTTSYRITGLQNGIEYGVAVAAVDKYGNISSVSDTVYASPISSTEQGGSCELAGWHGRPGILGGLGLLGIGLLVALRKRPRRAQR
jgi:hypothetical protein